MAKVGFGVGTAVICSSTDTSIYCNIVKMFNLVIIFLFMIYLLYMAYSYLVSQRKGKK